MLDVLEDERLPERAASSRRALRRASRASAATEIVAVRGSGLLAGVQLSSGELAAAAWSTGCARTGSSSGSPEPHDDVLKIRPPLVFSDEHAELLVAALSRTLA